MDVTMYLDKGDALRDILIEVFHQDVTTISKKGTSGICRRSSVGRASDL